MLCNNEDLIYDIEVTPTGQSDHNVINITTNLNHTLSSITNSESGNLQLGGMDPYKTNWELINKKIMEIDWNKKLESKNSDAIYNIIIDDLKEILDEHGHKRSSASKTYKTRNERKRKNLLRKRCRLAKKLKSTPHSNIKSKKISDKIDNIEMEIKLLLERENAEREYKAIEAIKTNSKFFFSYAKKVSGLNSVVGPLEMESGQLIHDGKEICEALQNQFVSVFSLPTQSLVEDIEEQMQNKLEDMEFSPIDIYKAIETIPAKASAGPDGIGAKILKECSKSLSFPLYKLWRTSLDESSIPAPLKIAEIKPIHKGGSKKLAKNYRPVSLTSHIIKSFEKIIKNVIVDFAEKNNLLQNFQHGFRAGRSCLTQLIDYYNSIMEQL